MPAAPLPFAIAHAGRHAMTADEGTRAGYENRQANGRAGGRVRGGPAARLAVSRGSGAVRRPGSSELGAWGRVSRCAGMACLYGRQAGLALAGEGDAGTLALPWNGKERECGDAGHCFSRALRGGCCYAAGPLRCPSTAAGIRPDLPHCRADSRGPAALQTRLSETAARPRRSLSGTAINRRRGP